MGLLDDAIREHLELKRRSGADPGEVAREQREALAVGGDAGAIEQDATLGNEETASAARDEGSEAAPQFPDDPVEGSASGHPPETGETAEIDMRAVFGEQPDSADSPPGEGDPAGSGGRGSEEALPTEESLEWEVPGEAGADDPHDDDRAEGEDPLPAEDVLEETPEFLRDTPEQERLWFEQQPPRDFDFDK